MAEASDECRLGTRLLPRRLEEAPYPGDVVQCGLTILSRSPFLGSGKLHLKFADCGRITVHSETNDQGFPSLDRQFTSKVCRHVGMKCRPGDMPPQGSFLQGKEIAAPITRTCARNENIPTNCPYDRARQPEGKRRRRDGKSPRHQGHTTSYELTNPLISS